MPNTKLHHLKHTIYHQAFHPKKNILTATPICTRTLGRGFTKKTKSPIMPDVPLSSEASNQPHKTSTIRSHSQASDKARYQTEPPTSGHLPPNKAGRVLHIKAKPSFATLISPKALACLNNTAPT